MEQNRSILARIGFGLLGLVVLIGCIPIAYFTWSMLPPGVYPQIAPALPAAPLIWVAYICFQKAGVTELISRPSGAAPFA